MMRSPANSRDGSDGSGSRDRLAAITFIQYPATWRSLGGRPQAAARV